MQRIASIINGNTKQRKGLLFLVAHPKCLFFEKIRRVPGISQKYAQSRVYMEIRSMHIYEN